MLRALLLPILLILGPVLPALAGEGHEIVIVLDNSASMIAGATVQGTGRKLPPNDPERAAVLGAMLVEGLARGSQDAVTVIGFGDGRNKPPRVVRDGDAIRAMPYGGGTWFKPALEAARDTLTASPRDDRLLILFTDGSPSDLDLNRPERTRAFLDPAQATTLAIGLYGGKMAQTQGSGFLRPLVDDPADLTLLDSNDDGVAGQVVDAFTESYARVLGSKPVTGQITSGETVSFEVGRYVTEVMITTASRDPGAPFEARVTGPSGDVPPRATGDNGCPPRVAPGNARNACDPPRRHFQAFRGANDPYAASTWTLSLPRAPGPVQYGVILRYDLSAELSAAPSTRVGEPVPLEAKLLFRGQTFVDEDFFGEDDFVAEVLVGDDVVPLTRQDDGRFVGSWTPTEPGSYTAEVVFRNTWMNTTDRAPVTVEGFTELVLAPTPNPLDLGSWSGARGSTSRCAALDLTGNVGAAEVPVTCTAKGASSQAVLSCAPVAGSEATLADGSTGQPQRWEVCVEARPCCDAGPAEDDEPFRVVLQGAHPHYAPGAVTVPVTWSVAATGFLACWWVEIAVVLGVLFLVWFVWGWLSPHAFDPSLSVRIAGSERALRRASALVLAEQPGGRRGFYRNARLCLTHDGTPVRKPKAARLVVEAGPRGTTTFRTAAGLQRQNRRTRKWEDVPEDELASGFDTSSTYRTGDLYLRFG